MKGAMRLDVTRERTRIDRECKTWFNRELKFTRTELIIRLVEKVEEVLSFPRNVSPLRKSRSF